MTPDQKVILYGAGYPDTAKIIARCRATGMSIDLLGYLDDTLSGEVMGYPVLGGRDEITRYRDEGCVFINNVFGTTEKRQLVTNLLEENGCTVVSLIDPGVDMAYTTVGKGVVISPGVHMGARVRIGDACAIRMGAVINHDNVLEENVFVGPGVTLCGHVQIGRGAFIGAGSTILPHVRIGEYVTVGAGAVVVKAVADGCTVVGVPAMER